MGVRSGVQLIGVACIFLTFSADHLFVFTWTQAQSHFLGGIQFASSLGHLLKISHERFANIYVKFFCEIFLLHALAIEYTLQN